MAKTDAELDSVKAAKIAAIKGMGADKSEADFRQLYAAAQKLPGDLQVS